MARWFRRDKNRISHEERIDIEDWAVVFVNVNYAAAGMGFEPL